MAPEHHPRPVRVAGSFGWFHSGGNARVPVLMCPPFGVEALASHIGWRDLASRLAAQGHDVLRMDYPGTGYSPGEIRGPDRLGCWQASIVEAIEALKSATGAAQVVVIGMRLGASLAARAVQGRVDVAGMVAMAPIVSGRRYAREITALAQMQGESGRSEDGIVLYGFEIAQETLDALAALDLASLPGPAPRGLMVSRSPAEQTLAKTWGFADEAFEGFEAFTENPTLGHAPEAVLTRVIAWCAEQPALPRSAADIRPLPAYGAREDGLVEEGVQFGPEESLFGLLTRPEKLASKLGIIISNAGRNPASGWGRRGVEMARALARAGHATLLFDAHGIGDSEREAGFEDEVLYSPRQEDDILAAAHLMLSHGAKGVFVIGTCSSAYSALHTARRAKGIVGLALVNLLRFHWQPGESLEIVTAQTSFRPTEAYGRRIFQLETWKRMLHGEIALAPIAATLVRRGLGVMTRPFVRLLSACGLAYSREVEAYGWFQTLEQQQVRILLVHSLEDPGLAELAAYFGAEGRRLKAFRQVSLHQIDGGDHNFSRVAGRQDLNQLLVRETAALAQGLEGSGKTAPRQ